MMLVANLPYQGRHPLIVDCCWADPVSPRASPSRPSGRPADGPARGQGLRPISHLRSAGDAARIAGSGRSPSARPPGGFGHGALGRPPDRDPRLTASLARPCTACSSTGARPLRWSLAQACGRAAPSGSPADGPLEDGRSPRATRRPECTEMAVFGRPPQTASMSLLAGTGPRRSAEDGQPGTVESRLMGHGRGAPVGGRARRQFLCKLVRASVHSQRIDTSGKLTPASPRTTTFARGRQHPVARCSSPCPRSSAQLPGIAAERRIPVYACCPRPALRRSPGPHAAFRVRRVPNGCLSKPGHRAALHPDAMVLDQAASSSARCSRTSASRESRLAWAKRCGQAARSALRHVRLLDVLIRPWACPHGLRRLLSASRPGPRFPYDTEDTAAWSALRNGPSRRECLEEHRAGRLVHRPYGTTAPSTSTATRSA